MPKIPTDWVPGRHNAALMVMQLILLWQAGTRGLDYITPRSPSEVLDVGLGGFAFPLVVWGALFYGFTVLTLIGLAARVAPVVITGHCALGAFYAAAGVNALLKDQVQVGWWVPLGFALSLVGLAIVFRRVGSTLVSRLLVGVPLMLVGQLIITQGLGQDYRTGTGLLAATLLHLTLAGGTWLIWTRQHLRQQVEREHGFPLPEK